MSRSIIIIGAGMGGMSAGIYGRLNGYETRIFEMHNLPGGQCTGWKRKGYTFDACIHHLFGCGKGTEINKLWRELGAMPQDMVATKDCVSVAAPDGTRFHDYYDTAALEQELTRLSPGDAAIIREYIKGIRVTARIDLAGAFMTGTIGKLLASFPVLLALFPYFRETMRQFGGRFSSPFLKRAVPLLEYSNPGLPVFIHFMKHAYGLVGDIAWPVGGSLAFARSMEKRYLDLGGEIQYRAKVEKILTEDGKAVGVRLADGTEHRADIVISNGDGRKTIRDLLDGKYLNERIRSCCAEPADESDFAVQIFFGVNRDFSKEPSSLIVLLDKPVPLAGRETHSIELQTFGFDPSLAPRGKGVIKVELTSKYSYWKALYADRPRYEEEKQKLAAAVLALLEPHFPGITGQVEVTDVATLMTWERYMNGTHGFNNAPRKNFDFIAIFMGRGQEKTLPGLENFYFTGVWMTSTGALFSNAHSGKVIIREICKKDRKRFKAV